MRSPTHRAARLLAPVLALAVAATACASGGAGDDGKVRVVTAFYPIEFAAAQVGGTLVEVTNITPPGGEPHDLELRPSDITRLRSADLILYFGSGFQPALESAIEALPDQTRAVDVLKGLPLRPAVEGDDHGEEEDHGDEELAVDPHVWLSPLLMEKLVDGVAAAIIQRTPANQTEIRRSTDALKRSLDGLDTEFETALATCRRREIFTSHAAFGYLAARYNLEQIPISGLSPEAEPSSKRLQEIAAQARREQATTIFFETLVDPRVSQTLARIVGARTAVLDPLEGLDDGTAGTDYFSVMRANLKALVEALDCST